MGRNSGFSLVECVVASVLLAVGLLALSGTSRAMLDLALLGHRTAGGADVAAARLASLHLSACTSPAPGEAISGPYRESWTVTGTGAVRSIAVEVAFGVSGTTHRVRVEAAIACPT